MYFRRCAALVACALVLVTATSCTKDTPVNKVSATETTSTKIATEHFNPDKLEWKPCPGSIHFSCATLSVPLDWRTYGDMPRRTDVAQRADAIPAQLGTPSKDTMIKLSVVRLPAKDSKKKLGSILVNPGGPGGSGTSIARSAQNIFSKEVLNRYDIVGWDPRGVEDSSAVECLTDAQMDASRQTDDNLDTDSGYKSAVEESKVFATRCQEKTKNLLGYVDSTSSAMDLETLRKALGEKQLNYLGYSYGTYLGSTYASMYPDRIGRFVLDGAMDPALSYQELGEGQAGSFEKTFRAYVEDCQKKSGCPLGESKNGATVDSGVKEVQNLLNQLGKDSLYTGEDDRRLTSSLAASAIIAGMYTTKLWPTLTIALSNAINSGDGGSLLKIADLYADRDSDGHYTTNSTEANIAINCIDYTTLSTKDEQRADAAELERLSPTFGRFIAYGGVQCEAWPYAPTAKNEKIKISATAPVVIIGTTGDPATPYEWSKSLTAQWPGSTLLTYEGYGHTAYGIYQGHPCIDEKVNAYFLDGTLPEAGATCS